MPDNRIKPSCNNCIYSFFKPDDPEELQRCKLVGRFNLTVINPLAIEAIARVINNPENLGFCEYHTAPKELKSRIDYNLISSP